MSVTTIEALCLKAQQAIGQREWDKAKLYYLQALGHKSDVPDIHYGLATVFFQLRELTSAAHHFREVTRLDPQRAGAYVNLGAVLNLLGEIDESLTTLRRGIQLDPKRVEGYYNLGLVHRRKGQADLAIQAYREALRLNPRMADAQLNLGNIFFEKGQYKQAIMHYEQASQLRPGWQKAADGLAQAKQMLAAENEASKPGAKAAPAKTATANLDRPVDPALHHSFLSQLHQAATDADENGKTFEQLLTKEVEPAIKELSSCLLVANGPRSELDDCLSKFEEALNRMRTLQQELQQSVGRVKNCGEHMPTN
jgi:Tfp pilus assembly protein PilF/exonuclease VII small subunit